MPKQTSLKAHCLLALAFAAGTCISQTSLAVEPLGGAVQAATNAAAKSQSFRPTAARKEVIRYPDTLKLPQDESLVKAVEKVDTKAISRALKRGANVNAARKNGLTPLMIASQSGKASVAQILIDAGAVLDIEARGSGLTALKLAAREGHINIAELLLDSGSNINHRGFNNQGDAFAGASALAHASAKGQAGMISRLLARGADPYLENSVGLTPIMYAAGQGKLEAVKALVDGGVKVGQPSSMGLTPLIVNAQVDGQWKMALYLLAAGANPDQQISASARAVNPETPGMTALMISALVGDETAFFTTLLGGADPDLKRADGKTALDLAIDSLKRAKSEKYQYKRREMIQRALSLPDWGKKKAMEVVAKALEKEIARDNVEIVTAGLRLGVDPNVMVDDDEPLFFAAIKEGNLPLVKLMLEYGAQANIKDRHGNTAFYQAMYGEHFDVSSLLASNGADANIIPADSDETLLHEFAGNGQVEGVKLLIRAGMRVDVRDSSQNTPLHKAARNGEIETFKILLAAGADPSLKNTYGDRPTDQVFDPKKTPAFLALLPGITTKGAPKATIPLTRQQQIAETKTPKGDDFDLGDLDL